MDRLLVEDLITSANWAEVAQNSFFNYHALGVRYLCLQHTPRFTIKLYHFDKHTPGGWIVWPHNHRYAFSSVTLAGSMDNVPCAIKAGDGYYLYTYDWKTRGTQLQVPCGLEFANVHVPAGKGFSMDTDGLHTITARPDTVVLQVQGHDQIDNSIMVVPVGDEPNCKDDLFYRKLSAEYWMRAADEIMELIK